MLEIKNLTIELMDRPLGLDITQPRFSYIIKADGQEITQQANRIRVIEGVLWDEKREPLWDTQKRESSQSVHISYEGEDLHPKTAYTVKIEI